MDARLAASYATCRELARLNGKSFYFASYALPPGRRRATYALYAFCRTADDLVDRMDETSSEGVMAELSRLRAGLAAIYRGEDPGTSGLWPALADTIRRHRIPPEPFFDLLDGVAMDLSCRRYPSYAELEGYCYKVASVVGLMMCHVFGYRDPRALPYAEKMGLAMQLTNILRDVGEDLRMGRIYLPTEELEAFGLDERDLREGCTDARFQGFMKFQIARARTLYAEAHAGIHYLSPFSRLTAHLMGRVYAGILSAIERQGYDVYRSRAFITSGEKVQILLGCLVSGLLPGERRPPDPLPLAAEERIPLS